MTLSTTKRSKKCENLCEKNIFNGMHEIHQTEWIFLWKHVQFQFKKLDLISYCCNRGNSKYASIPSVFYKHFDVFHKIRQKFNGFFHIFQQSFILVFISEWNTKTNKTRWFWNRMHLWDFGQQNHQNKCENLYEKNKFNDLHEIHQIEWIFFRKSVQFQFLRSPI